MNNTWNMSKLQFSNHFLEFLLEIVVVIFPVFLNTLVVFLNVDTFEQSFLLPRLAENVDNWRHHTRILEA